MNLGKFRVVQSLGKGGMGEVFLAEDTVCHRIVALKKIRDDLVKFTSIRNRFLREAHIAAKLSHPAIIPIFSICEENEMVYYTMPYVEGKTLRQILKEADERWTIPALMPLFISLCQAVAFSHSKKILHRDLKPENIIVGTFGQVVILDWGLAIEVGEKEEVLEEIPTSSNLTKPGKIVGTLAYLAPERARNEPASEQTDLYALGVILYQILTLRLPFKRRDIESFQKMWSFEELIDPVELAPYREIPHALSQIVKKALQPSPENRYKTVSDLIVDLERYIEGKPDWIVAQQLKIDWKGDWEFQENILLAKHVAITRSTDVMEWVNLMISRASFSGNTKIETSVKLGSTSHGVGFLLNIPHARERKSLMDGYCIWIGSEKSPGCRIARSNIDVLYESSVALPSDVWQAIRIEKTDNHLRLFIEDELRCHYLSQSPFAGSHIGLMCRDVDLEISELKVFLGSQNVTVSCLTLPDSYLADKNYTRALAEYRQIAFSFPGRAEGREALFRAGITLLEAASAGKKSQLYSLALEEFGKLRGTAGAPLEYLGKSIVYNRMGEREEEAKCVELAIRKYHNHPLFARLIEHVIIRLHESSQNDRISAYHFALLAIRHLPQIFTTVDHQQLIDNLEAHWEQIPFLKSTVVYLAFFLDKPITLLELIESGSCGEEPFYALLELGYHAMVQENPRLQEFPDIQLALQGTSSLSSTNSPTLKAYLIQQALDHEEPDAVLHSTHDTHSKLWASLLKRDWKGAGTLFDTIAPDELNSENSPYFPLYGCFLWATEGEEKSRAHFNSFLETAYPKSSALLSHFLAGKIDLKKGWIKKAFKWEKMELYRHLILLNICRGLSPAPFKRLLNVY